MIRNLHHSHIDKERWDALVSAAPHSGLYATSAFLDAVCPDWHGLVLDDYKAVMPLPEKRRLGFRYLVQPVFSQQYAISTRQQLRSGDIQYFKQELLRYKSIRICLAEPLFGNERMRTNMLLDLSAPYETLARNYSENTRRNIRKAQSGSLVCEETADPKTAVDRFLAMDERNFYTPYEQEIRALLRSFESETYCARRGSETLATAIFLKHGAALYYLFPASTAEGKRARAMFLLMDAVVKKHAGTGCILDFEGSDLPGVRRFYEGFGGRAVPYFFFAKRLLPAIL